VSFFDNESDANDETILLLFPGLFYGTGMAELEAAGISAAEFWREGGDVSSFPYLDYPS
jgi:hypothetical protein